MVFVVSIEVVLGVFNWFQMVDLEWDLGGFEKAKDNILKHLVFIGEKITFFLCLGWLFSLGKYCSFFMIYLWIPKNMKIILKNS
jgi:hypothetical protein